MSNHFQNVIDEVQNAPQAQRCDKLVEGIAKQMQQSGVSAQQLGQELTQAQQQITKAFNQRQQG